MIYALKISQMKPHVEPGQLKDGGDIVLYNLTDCIVVIRDTMSNVRVISSTVVMYMAVQLQVHFSSTTVMTPNFGWHRDNSDCTTVSIVSFTYTH